MNKNKFFRQFHIYLSLFFLPCAFIFALTGIAYIFGINQDIGLEKQIYTLNERIEKGQEIEKLLDFLKDNNIKIPSNTQTIKSKDKGITIGSTHYSVSIAENGENQYQITTKTRSFLGDLIMLHKDKGAWYFSVLSVGFGVSLFLLYISGLMMTLFASKKDRKNQILVLIAGILITFILAYISL